MDVDGMRVWAQWAEVMDTVAAATGALGAGAWLVGGAPRDVVMGRPLGDLDIAVACAPSALADTLAGEYRPTVAHLNRDSLRIGLRPGGGAPPLQLDLSPLRGPDIAADLARRDFTCNALALPLAAWAELLAASAGRRDLPSRRAALASLLDPLGGVRDIEERVLRPAGESSFTDEPGRIFRAARMLAAFGFSASAELSELARRAVPLLAKLTPERIRTEMNALLALPACGEGLRFLADVGALPVLAPRLADEVICGRAVAAVAATRWLQDELPGGQNVGPLAGLASSAPLRDWYAASLPEGIPRIAALRWGLLLHGDSSAEEAPESDHGARTTDGGTGARLRVSRYMRATAAAVAEGSRWRALLARRDPSMPELRAAADRWQDRFADLLTSAAACDASLAGSPIAGTASPGTVATRARVILERFLADREAFVPLPLLDGLAVARVIGVTRGPEIGRVLREVRRAQLAGDVATREEALSLARRLTGALS